MQKPQALSKESSFDFNELFFSTTNEKGNVLYGNDVFVRVSRYPRETLVGAPHSIVRHPDMPRAVFKLFWNTIQAGLPIAAYVKNLAADGSYYWVFAFAFPIEQGYLSIRIKPSSDLFLAAQKIYTEILTLESSVSLEESLNALLQKIQAAGFKNYTDFMIQAAFLELNSLEKNQQAKHHFEYRQTDVVQRVSNLSLRSSGILKECFGQIQGFQKSNMSFVKTMNDLSESFRRLKYISLNMTISAAKFQETGASLGVVAKEFSKVSEEIHEHLVSLLDFVASVSAGVEKSAVCAVGLDTQMRMVDFFIRESIQKMAGSQNAFSEMLAHRPSFSALFNEGTATMSREMTSLGSELANVVDKIMEVRKLTTGLEVIRQMGAIESSRENETRQTFVHYLDEMRNFVNLLQSATHLTHKEIYEMRLNCQAVQSAMQDLVGAVDEIFDLASEVHQVAV